MVRRVFLFIALFLITGYMVVAITLFNLQPANQVCYDMTLVLKDTTNAVFVTKNEISAILQKKELYPIGKKLAQIHSRDIENELNKHPLIDQTECYKTPSGKLKIEVHQRVPILRVISNKGENYYIDNKGSIMPPNAKCIAHRVIATGNVEKSFAMRYLYKFGVFLQDNKFWEAQIEQIHVLPNLNVELVPRVGNHIIYLGNLENIEEKLARLKVFYEKALSKVGWNKYSRINLEFGNQIICTKREE